MLDLVEDGAGGMHDMMIAACDQARYEQFGFVGPHASCSENLRSAMARLGHAIEVVPQPVNFFTNTVVEPDGKLTLAAQHACRPAAMSNWRRAWT